MQEILSKIYKNNEIVFVQYQHINLKNKKISKRNSVTVNLEKKLINFIAFQVYSTSFLKPINLPSDEINENYILDHIKIKINNAMLNLNFAKQVIILNDFLNKLQYSLKYPGKAPNILFSLFIQTYSLL